MKIHPIYYRLGNFLAYWTKYHNSKSDVKITYNKESIS